MDGVTFKYLAGTAANLVTGATITASSEDANFDADNVGVGWPAQAFKFNAAALDDTLSADLLSAKSPTLISVHGHNIDAGVTSITVLSDDNSSFTSPVTEATITTYPAPSFFTVIASPTSHRYWRLKFNGTNGAVIKLGEVGIGVLSSLTRAQLDAFEVTETRPQMRYGSGVVEQPFAENLADFQQRSVKMTFICQSYTERNELRNELFVNTGWGVQPLIFMPDEDDEIVIHGRVPSGLAWERKDGPSGGYHRATFTILEDPYSLALAST